MLLLIDNYDSFTFNLVQRFGELDRFLRIEVVRNDQITVEEAEALRPSRLVISPGPCTPREAGVSAALIRHFRGRIPKGLFEGMSNPFVATRYHSLVVDPATIPEDFEKTAWTAKGEVMGLRWKAPDGASPLEGVQFHPESFLTKEGPQLLENFLRMI